MRDTKVITPKTIKELTNYIDNLENQDHDYGTCVYAMSMSATAAFNYIAHKLGVTGFQASCADLDILRRIRGIKGSFILFKAEDLLYPQYDLNSKFIEWQNEQKEWLKGEAKKLLVENKEAHPNVKAYWKKLING